jgi:hypothetical protein
MATREQSTDGIKCKCDAMGNDFATSNDPVVLLSLANGNNLAFAVRAWRMVR